MLGQPPHIEMMWCVMRVDGSRGQIRRKTRTAGAVHKSETTMRAAGAIARNTANLGQAMPIVEEVEASTAVVTDGAIDWGRGLAHDGCRSVAGFHTRKKVWQKKKREEVVHWYNASWYVNKHRLKTRFAEVGNATSAIAWMTLMNERGEAEEPALAGASVADAAAEDRTNAKTKTKAVEDHGTSAIETGAGGCYVHDYLPLGPGVGMSTNTGRNLTLNWMGGVGTYTGCQRTS